jgi:DNA (cytosine-5)-methyltransferase 1
MIKPAFSIPSMSEVEATPKNGLNAISLFAGCGGSSLGYRMAGYNILLANEFLPAAQEER